MATRGYDDSETIRRIETLLATGRYPSRRAAIMDIAGPENLRRIERKMGKVDQPTSVKADVAIEGAVSEGQAALLMYERQMLEKSGEKVRRADFSDAEIVFERLERSEARSVRPERIDEYAWHGRLAAKLVAIPFLLSVAAIAFMTFIVLMDTAIKFGFMHAEILGPDTARTLPDLYNSATDFLRGFVFLTLFLAMPFLFFNSAHLLYKERYSLETARLREQAAKESLNRYLLTDRAFYALSLRGGSIQVSRMTAAKVHLDQPDEDGDVVLECEGSRVTVAAVPDTSDLVAMLRRDLPVAA